MYMKTRVKIPKFLHFWQISQIPGIIDPAMRDPISILRPRLEVPAFSGSVTAKSHPPTLYLKVLYTLQP